MPIQFNAAVVGIGNTPYGKLPEYDSNALAVWVLRNALADAWLRAVDIDGLVMHRIGYMSALSSVATPAST